MTIRSAQNGILDALNLDGTVIVVTGGGTGLGRVMARALAAAGADLVVAGRRFAPLAETVADIETTGRRGLAVSADVTDSASVSDLLESAISTMGRVDVLINNAGMVRGQGGTPIWDVTDEMWQVGIDAILSGAFYCSRAFSKHMVDRGSGKIINVSSGLGLRGARDNYMYACGKGAIIQLTRSLAVSLGRYGITSNCIVPGFFPTDATSDSSMALPSGEFIPVGRTGLPSDLGPVALWLSSSASDYMTGEMVVVDGGGLAGGFAPTGYSLGLGSAS